MLTNLLGGRVDRHGWDHRHDQRLEQQGEAAARARPGDGHLPDPTVGAVDARHPCMQPRLMPEEVEMAPYHLFGAIRWTVRRVAARAGKTAAPRKIEMNVETVPLRVEFRARNSPERGVSPSASCSRWVSRMMASPQGLRPERGWRRARRRQGRFAPRKRALAYGHP